MNIDNTFSAEADVNLPSEAAQVFSSYATTGGSEKIDKAPGNPGLSCGAAGAGVMLISKLSTECHTTEQMPFADIELNCERLTRMELRRKYKAEANSHRNMLGRRRKSGAVVHPEFLDFVSFLRIVGPIPAPRATLDRIDNTDPEYAPGKVRWADKRTQNSNKSDTLIFYDSLTGEAFTTSRLAKLLKQKAATIRKHRERGWSDDEIIAGRRAPLSPATYLGKKDTPSVPNLLHASKPKLSHSPKSKSAAQIQFEEDAGWFALCRTRDGEEALPAPHSAINEGLPEALHVSEELWKKRFVRLWPSVPRQHQWHRFEVVI